ncbi:MAG: class I adenylate-forming enzyme family protein, partial [Ignavibacteriaceae bacterium]
MNFLEEISHKRKNFNPELPAIIGKNKVISYSELKEKTLSASQFLSGKQINKNEPVAILSDNNPDFIILTLALWLIDAIPVPINTKLRRGEIQQLLEIAGCKKIFIHKSCDNGPELTSIHKFGFPFESKTVTGNVDSSKIDLENTAVIIFTSGSSGTPKGVMLSFSNLLRSAEIGNQVLQQSEKERWLASLPFYHIGGFSIITRAFLYGASIIIPESLSTRDLKFSFENQNPTLASLVG